MKRSPLLTISEMASLCRISRQTLIYYDKNDVFKPIHTDDKGYRYYSVHQVPFLREICALKDNDFSLKDIVDHFQDRNIKNMQDLFRFKKQTLEEEIEQINLKLKSINERLAYYDYVKEEMQHIQLPYIRQFPERKILFCSWDSTDTEDMDRTTLHFTHMKLRNRCDEFHLKIDRGWGALLRKDHVGTDRPFVNAGGYVNLPPNFENIYDIPEENYLVIPAGFFVCMCKYGMPYEVNFIDFLIRWIEDNHYTITGDILDECLLDTTFYTEEQQKDFCQLQIPVKLPGVTI